MHRTKIFALFRAIVRAPQNRRAAVRRRCATRWWPRCVHERARQWTIERLTSSPYHPRTARAGRWSAARLRRCLVSPPGLSPSPKLQGAIRRATRNRSVTNMPRKILALPVRLMETVQAVGSASRIVAGPVRAASSAARESASTSRCVPQTSSTSPAITVPGAFVPASRITTTPVSARSPRPATRTAGRTTVARAARPV